MTNSYDVICIGAGPTGLACAIEAKRAGMRSLVIDKGCLCNSLYHYPTNMNFFTTPERMEIGDIPMTISGGKPTRVEALKYYRRAVEHYGIDLRLYERVERIAGEEGDFVVHTASDTGPRAVPRKENRHRHRLLRPAESAGNSRRGPPQRFPLFHRPAPLLESGSSGHRRTKLRRRSSPGIISRRRPRHPDPSRTPRWGKP